MVRLRSANLGLAAVASLLVVAPSAPVTAKDSAGQTIEGSWQGDFGAGQWTFTFSKASGGWVGKYTYPQYKGWNPVLKLAASSETARFSLNAKTTVDFNLKLDRSRNGLSGTVRFGQGSTAGSPPVVVPVQLRRVG